ncbi:hypothetical protein K8R78_06295 [bacterium]|nr:hypothetical protein [bacterium]
MKKFSKVFLVSFLAPVPLILISVFESDLREMLGNDTMEVLFPLAIVFTVGLILFTTFKSFAKPMAAAFGWGKDARMMKNHGRPASATIMSIGENSEGGTVTINDQPYLNLQLEVHERDVQPYVVSLDTVISRSAIPQFQPGATIPILIHPENPDKVMINWQGQPETPSYGRTRSALDQQLMDRAGIDCKATIIKVEPTGRSEDFNIVVRVTYEIDAPGRDIYQFDKETALPSHVIQLMQKHIGKPLEARLHPDDDTKISVRIE